MQKNLFYKNLSIFLSFNLIFVILQFFIIYQYNDKLLLTMHLPFSAYSTIISVIIIQMVLYLLLSLLQTLWVYSIQHYQLLQKNLTYQWHIIIIIISIIFILTTNCYFFPLSKFSQLFLPNISKYCIQYISVITGIIFIGLTINGLLIFKKLLLIIILILCGYCLYSYITSKNIMHYNIIQTKSPNIILIGIDSLHPRRLNHYNTPTLYNFMHTSTYFKNTISPLARTYPAWTTILTGLYPLHHHARENLIPINLVKSKASIAWQLNKLHYQTIFATDDRRFNNIDKDFGFQKIIGPKLGINDFILGNYYDLPLSNLLINIPIIGELLFPYQHNNRASSYVYQPNTFNRSLKNFLAYKTTQPIFLAVHFTLPHWPYIWSESSLTTINAAVKQRNYLKLYQQSLHAVDLQIKNLLDKLQSYQLLHNSLLIILSDHGEAFYNEAHSRIINSSTYQGHKPSALVNYFKNMTSTKLTRSIGHGSDILSPIQFYCLLNIKIFNNKQQINPKQKINTRVALIDIAPTIYNFLKIKSHKNLDGISLLGKILHPEHHLIKRAFILESGLLPNVFISTKNIATIIHQYYTINKYNQHVELHQNQLQSINAMKLYGIIEGNWLFALYPNKIKYIPVIVRLSDHYWTDQIYSEFAQSIYKLKLLQKLRNMYNNELQNYPFISN